MINLELGRYAEAEENILVSLNVLKTIYEDDHAEVATTLNNLGLLYSELGRYQEAEMQYKKRVC